MTSLLPVCVALLLPACVLGQVLFYEDALSNMCRSNVVQIEKITSCMEVFDEYKNLFSLEILCRNINVVVNHNSCLRTAWLPCVAEENRGLIQTDAIVSDSLHYLCDNINATDYDCAFTTADDCVKPLYQSYAADLDKPGLVDRTCRALHTVGQCIHDSCTAQGHSMDVYDLYWRKAYAPACSSSSRFSPSSVSLTFAACAVLLAKMAARML